MKIPVLIGFVTVLTLFTSCKLPNSGQTVFFELPQNITESSGITITDTPDLIWTMEDSGNAPELYGMDRLGNLVHTISITNLENTDWEDITADSLGNLYIGDFGNNKNVRKDLAIYKVNQGDLRKDNVGVSDKISFFYPEQKDFPPKKSERFFDVESFFIFNNNFYLFTKNRSSHFDGTTNLYRIPNQTGNHAAELIGSYKTGGDFDHCAIAGAAISKDGKKIALLSRSKIWVFTEFTGDNFLLGNVREINFDNLTQKEGICFVGNDILYVTDEKDKNQGGNLYKIDLGK